MAYKVLSVTCILGILAACGTVPPRVHYAAAPSTPEADVKSPGHAFWIPRSLLLLEPGTVENEKTVKVTAVPSELDENGNYLPLYHLTGIDDWRSTTALQVTYIANTKFIDTIGVKTTDNVQKTIQSVSGVLQAGISFAAAAGSMPSDRVGAKKQAIKAFQRAVIDPASPKSNWTVLPNNPGIWYKLSTVSESKVTATEFFNAAASERGRVVPIAACSMANLELGFAPFSDNSVGKPLEEARPLGDVVPGPSLQVTYADSKYVIPIVLPSSGSMKMHTICGADTTEDGKADRTTVLDQLKTAMEETQKIWKAWQDAKKAAVATK